jgi:alpha-mannosidase
MAQSENDLRLRLGIPPLGDPRAERVMLLCPTPHLDWDWEKTFLAYYQSEVQTIFTDAARYMAAANPQAYSYAVAEVGYLRQFATDQPALWEQMRATGLLHGVGGGITSPDNLLPHGETLLRNYLVGSVWLRQNLPDYPLAHAWIPDDFGHDPNFPALLEAMGFTGVAFERVPGWSNPHAQNPTPFPPGSTAAVLSQGPDRGVDFVWQAQDGSSLVAHWLMGGYGDGGGITGDGASAAIASCYQVSQDVSRTPYIYVAVGEDFYVPQADLPQRSVDWNAAPAVPGVFTAVASFDEYVEFLGFYRDALPIRGQRSPGPGALPFAGTPYWTGFYATRPEIKIQHHAATRALLGAELFGAIAASFGGVSVPSAEPGWHTLVPSTHHDFITGTAANLAGIPGQDVYQGEQLPLLAQSLQTGQESRAAAQRAIAGLIDPPSPSGLLPVAVFNQLGFARGGLAETVPLGGFTPASVVDGDGRTVLGPVQESADGTWLFTLPDGGVPSTGYNLFYLGTGGAPSPGPLSLQVYQDAGGQWVAELTNGFLHAIVRESASGGLAELFQLYQGVEYPALSGVANNPLYYSDSGDLYRFGNESKGGTFEAQPASFALTAGFEALESGPVRVRLRVSGIFSFAGSQESVVREYALVWNEPFLRLSTTAAAPRGTSVLVEFPLTDTADQIYYGTPYHWTINTAIPESATWPAPVFQPTHDFVAPMSGGPLLGAVYHEHLPAWAVSADERSLFGCLVRNCPTTWVGGDADDDTHTLSYAFRVSVGLEEPATGMPLRESLAWQTPLAVQAVPGGSGLLPTAFSFASPSDPRVLVTAVKPGSVPGVSDDALVLRLYNPTNGPLELSLSLAPAPGGKAWEIAAVTALELPPTEGAPVARVGPVEGTEVALRLERSVTTLALRAR